VSQSFYSRENFNLGSKHFIIEPLRQRFLEQRLRTVFESFGFREITTPTIELGNSYSNCDFGNTGSIYHFTDKSGHVMFLRPDLTTSIAKLVATHFRFLEKPIRLYYIANSFLSDKDYMEREFYHAGAEIIGSNTREADVEMMIMAIEALQKIGITEFKMDIGHVAFWEYIFREAEFKVDKIITLYNLLRNKNFTSFIKEATLLSIPDDLREVINNAPFLRGKFDLLNSLGKISKYKEMNILLDSITDTCTVLDEYGVGDYFTLDFSLVGDLGYYSGYIFEFYTKDMGSPVGSGGRYDCLLGHFGYECPATGFSINIGKIIKALEKKQSLTMAGEIPDFFITKTHYSPKILFKVARELRRKGFLVEMEITEKTLDESLNYARKRDIKSVIILGTNEKNEIQILLKNMETDDDTIIDFDEFLL